MRNVWGKKAAREKVVEGVLEWLMKEVGERLEEVEGLFRGLKGGVVKEEGE